jgi:hypothetical protein
VLERDFRTRATVITFTLFTFAAGTAREIRGGEKIPWDHVVAAIAADARASGIASGIIYSLEGFTSLPAAFYAAELAPGFRVRPVADLAAETSRESPPGVPPAWLVVRSSGSGDSAALGDGLMPRGITLRAVHQSRVPSHAITAYRIVRGP